MWEELAAALKDEPSVVVAEVECPDAKKICDEVGVKGFPTIASSFGGEKKEVFKGARTRGPLEKFARWVFVFDGRRLLAGLAALDCSRLLSTSRYSLLALSPTRCQIARDPLDVRDGAVVILLNDSNVETHKGKKPPSFRIPPRNSPLHSFVSKEIGKDLGGVPGPRFVHRGHEVDELFVDLVAELAAFGGATVDDFALFGCLVELGCSDGGVGVEEFVEEGGVKVGVDVGFGDGGRVVCGCARGYRVPGVVVLAVRGGAVCGVWCVV